MSGIELLKHRPPLRAVRLRGLQHYHLDDETGERYEMTVWARPCSDGWTGWYRKESVTLDPEITWLSDMWEEVK